MFAWYRRRRREALRRRPFPDTWRAIVGRNVAYVAWLPPADVQELLGHVQIFLAEKRFEGCGGLRLTDEMRVTIAAQACILLLHRETDCYPDLVSILVYPSSYLVPVSRRTPEGLVVQGRQVRAGESWAHGTVVLAWDDVLSGAADMNDGRNLVLHEFAHQLDHENGAGDGAPALPQRSMYAAWARVLGREFEQLVHDAKWHHETLINQYGATSPAEFFAVVTETFFERPHELRATHPELYAQLQQFYLQDPAALRPDGAAPFPRGEGGPALS